MPRAHTSDQRPNRVPAVVRTYVDAWTSHKLSRRDLLLLTRHVVLQTRPQSIAEAAPRLAGMADYVRFLDGQGVRLSATDSFDTLFEDSRVVAYQRGLHAAAREGVITAASERTMISRLNALAQHLAFDRELSSARGRVHRTEVSRPLPDADFAAWEIVARAQTPVIGLRFQGLLYCCRGAGCDGEDLRYVRGTSIHRTTDGELRIAVQGRRAREATVLDRYAGDLESVADALGDDLIVGQWPHRNNATSDLINSVAGGTDLVRPLPRPLRRAYVVELLGTDIHMIELIRQLGRNSLAEVESSLPFVPARHHDRSPLRTGAPAPTAAREEGPL